MHADDMFILQKGAYWASNGEKAWLELFFLAGDVYVNVCLVGAVDECMVQDRERLAHAGFVVFHVPVNIHQRLAGERMIFSRGFLHLDDSDELMETVLAELK